MVVRVRSILGVLLFLGLVTACGGSPDKNSSSTAGGGAGTTTDAGSGGANVGGQANAGASGTSTAGSDAGELSGAESGGAGAGGTAIGGGGVGGTVNGGAGGLALAGSAGRAGGPPIDIGTQKKASKLDVLFVVDNSVSMADKQSILEASLPRFVQRLINPNCVDAQGKPTLQQPASGASVCSTGKREFTPVSDMHLGVISTSIGAHGGTVCTTGAATDTLDDRAQLMPTMRLNISSYNGLGYSSFDAAGVTGSSDANAVITQVQATVSAAGEHGCGFEAPLEAMYRFLVDPEPPQSVALVGNVTAPIGINADLLAQRASFLRPDSAVAIVLLSDESDCSIRDDGVGWFVGSSSRMPRSTAACDTNVNDPCCRSCAQNEAAPPTGCSSLTADSVCSTVPAGQSYATWDQLHDSLNLRCFDQHRRFGFDLLYPVDRYSNGLTNTHVLNRAGQQVDNPLFAARDGKGPRSATLVSVSVIVGAPWQDLATTNSLTTGQPLEYLDGSNLASKGRWPILLGSPASNEPPSDPFMRESVTARSGTNPLTQAPIVPATSTSPVQSPINGHEQNIPDLSDLQYACTFALSAPRVCVKGDSACDCSPDNNDSEAAVVASNSPLCQPPTGGAATSKQYYGKGYPGTRELSFAQQLGSRALAGSICPKTLTNSASADYAYTPALNALIGRIGVTLK